MGLKYAIHQVDQNAESLYEYAEAQGFTVERLGRPTDALVALANGMTAVVEVKRGKGKLRPSQEKFFARWPGFKAVWREEHDVLETKRCLLRERRDV